jgi:serine/threonine protein kinase
LEIKEGFQFNGRLYVVFEELGKNLEEARLGCGGRFSLKTTLMIGLQMLERIEYIHELGFLHGDIKPSNFQIGKSPKVKHKIFLTDFELSHRY